jgi:hypothetical protein
LALRAAVRRCTDEGHASPADSLFFGVPDGVGADWRRHAKLLITSADGAVVSGRTTEFGFNVQSEIMIGANAIRQSVWSICTRHRRQRANHSDGF